jgi:hypothetical protein
MLVARLSFAKYISKASQNPPFFNFGVKFADFSWVFLDLEIKASCPFTRLAVCSKLHLKSCRNHFFTAEFHIANLLVKSCFRKMPSIYFSAKLLQLGHTHFLNVL